MIIGSEGTVQREELSKNGFEGGVGFHRDYGVKGLLTFGIPTSGDVDSFYFFM
jgi:hypothetical protein